MYVESTSYLALSCLLLLVEGSKNYIATLSNVKLNLMKRMTKAGSRAPATSSPLPRARPAGVSTRVAAQPRLWCVVLHRVFQLEVVESRCSVPPAAAIGAHSGARCRLGLESR
jgi:hypothetical protein